MKYSGFLLMRIKHSFQLYDTKLTKYVIISIIYHFHILFTSFCFQYYLLPRSIDNYQIWGLISFFFFGQSYIYTSTQMPPRAILFIIYRLFILYIIDFQHFDAPSVVRNVQIIEICLGFRDDFLIRSDSREWNDLLRFEQIIITRGHVWEIRLVSNQFKS